MVLTALTIGKRRVAMKPKGFVLTELSDKNRRSEFSL